MQCAAASCGRLLFKEAHTPPGGGGNGQAGGWVSTQGEGVRRWGGGVDSTPPRPGAEMAILNVKWFWSADAGTHNRPPGVPA